MFIETNFRQQCCALFLSSEHNSYRTNTILIERTQFFSSEHNSYLSSAIHIEQTQFLSREQNSYRANNLLERTIFSSEHNSYRSSTINAEERSSWCDTPTFSVSNRDTHTTLPDGLPYTHKMPAYIHICITFTSLPQHKPRSQREFHSRLP